jgi:hypothetical protein
MIKKVFSVSACIALVPGLGAAVFLNILRIYWHHLNITPEHSSQIQSDCLLLTGFALCVLGTFALRTLEKLSVLEKELARLKAGETVA